MRTIIAISCAIIGASLLSFPAVAQQKTVKACQEEWRANKDANQAKGITEKAYVTQCRACARIAAQPAPSATTATASHRRPPDKRQSRHAGDEWRANKDANQAKGITEKAYVTQCRAGGTVAVSPRQLPHLPHRQQRLHQHQLRPAAPPATTGARPASTAPTGANQYTTEARPELRCGAGTVVWANSNSKIYHFTGYKDYGKTKTGAYMCEQDATGQGMRAAKNEKHP